MTSRDDNDIPDTTAGVVNVPSTEVGPEAPASFKTRSWNPAKIEEVRARLAESNIPWTDDPTEDWMTQTERQLRKNGNVQFANQLKSYVIRSNPTLARPLGREQQEKSARAARQQQNKQNRTTVPNARNQRVAKKYPMTLILGGTLLGLLLLSGVGYGAYSAYKQSAADAAARQSAQASQQAQANTPVQQVDPADPNQIIDTNPSQGTAVGPEGAATDATGVGTGVSATDPNAGTGTGVDGSGTASVPPGTEGDSQPASAISPPPDTEALQQRYDQGKRDGQVSGYSAGQDEGYAKGKTEGQQSGFSQGRTQGQQEGYGQGRTEGQQQGYQAGQQAAQQAAQAQGARGTGAAGTSPATAAAAPVGRVTLTPVPSGRVVPVAAAPNSSQTAVSPPVQPVPGKLTFTATGSGNTGASAARLSFAGSAGGQGNAGGGAGSGSGAAGNGAGAASGRGSFELRTAPEAASTRSNTLTLNQGASPADSAASSAAGAGSAGAAGSSTGANGGRLMLLSAGGAQGNAGSGNASASTTGTVSGSGSDEVQFGNVTLVVPGSGTGSPTPGAGAPAAGTGTTNTASSGASAPALGSTAAQTAGAADPRGVNFGPYRPYQTINARLQTASLILETSAVNLPVIAISSDGRKWIGTGTVIGAQRVNLQFTQVVDLDGKTVLPVPAAAYDASGVPGVQGSGQDLAPDLVRNLLRNAASGVRDYAQAQLNASTTTVTPNGSVVVEKAAPTLWTMVGSRALSVFDLPTNTQTFTRATYLPAGTPLVLMVGATQQQSAQPGR